MTTVPRLTVWPAVALLAVAGTLAGRGAIESEAGSGSFASAERSPVVVELFTSQGCSSCPPADRFLTELAAREDVGVIALSFHVDYWNYIGWTDPFSSASWSDRQRRYARVFGGDRVYTPQMVINGRWEDVGSNRREISRLLEQARAAPAAAEISVYAESISDQQLRVAVTVDRIDSQVGSKQLAAWVAVVESALVTPVGRGENAAKTLRNDRVVRHLARLAKLEPIRSGATASLEVALEPGWRRDQLEVVSFFQDTESMHIVAATQRAVPDPR